MNSHAKKNKAFILLLAVLIASIMLAMSMGVFAIALKEITLSSFARDSTKAFAAASRGLECAMFSDRINDDAAFDLGTSTSVYDPSLSKLPWTPFIRGDPSLFTGAGSGPGESWNLGNNVTAAVGSPSQIPLACGKINGTSAQILNYSTSFTAGQNKGMTTFDIQYPDACASVVVTKNGILTTFTSNGYSDCNVNNPRRTQRTIEVSVNI